MLNMKRGRSVGGFPLPFGASSFAALTSFPASFSPLTSSAINDSGKNVNYFVIAAYRYTSNHQELNRHAPFFTSDTSVLSLASVVSVVVGVPSRFSFSFSFSSPTLSPSAKTKGPESHKPVLCVCACQTLTHNTTKSLIMFGLIKFPFLFFCFHLISPL